MYNKQKKIAHLIFIMVLFLAGCIKKPKNLENFDVQGHRGARGLYPENTFHAMIAAIDCGVNTLEMDLVITKDNRVVLSHEPYMNHKICLDSNQQNITESREKSFNIYEMSFEEISCFDCGSKGHPDFLNQKKTSAFKPLFKEVVTSIQAYIKENKKQRIQYNLEIKRKPQWDNIYHPEVNEYVRLILKEISDLGIENKCIIQSFDVESLNLVHQLKPKIKTSLLVEKGQLSIEENLNRLNFTPSIYSPEHQSVSEEAVKLLHQKNILVIPWTVNNRKDMISLIQQGVDGLITDYPNDLIRLID